MATIGHVLSSARVAAGYSVAELSARTRIREPVLRAVEAEDFASCGGDFYARGHIKSLCRALNLDPVPLLEEFDREHAEGESPYAPLPRSLAARAVRAGAEGQDGGDRARRVLGEHDDPLSGVQRWGHFERRSHLLEEVRGHPDRAGAPAGVPEPRRTIENSPEAAQPPYESRGRHAARSGPRPALVGERRAGAVRRHWPWAVIVLLFALSVLVGYRAWQDWGEAGPLSAVLDGGENTGTTVLPPEAEAVEAQSGTGEEAGADGELAVRIHATARSWVQLTGSEGEELYTGYIMEDETRTYTSDGSITLWTANAGAVNVSVNGRDLGTIGLPGEVKEVDVDASGFSEE